MNKKEYEKSQKKEKIKLIVKYVLLFLGWGLLLTATISLLVVGLRGCNNKSNKTASTNEVGNRIDNEPSYRGVNDNQSGLERPSDEIASLFCGVGGFTQSGDIASYYEWDYLGGTYAPWLSTEVPSFYLELTTNVERYRLFTLEVTDGNDIYNAYNVYKVTHDFEHEEIIFYYYNGSYSTYTIDQRDFDYDAIHHLKISFPLYNFDWVLDSNDYVFRGSLVLYDFDSTYYAPLSSGLKIGSFYDMFLSRSSFVGGSYGWQIRSHNQGGNEAGGNTNNGDVTPSGGLYGVFSLLAGAFGAVTSILSIMIIPGVTIGTLVVLPLVVTLIIFIVSLFKR